MSQIGVDEYGNIPECPGLKQKIDETLFAIMRNMNSLWKITRCYRITEDLYQVEILFNSQYPIHCLVFNSDFHCHVYLESMALMYLLIEPISKDLRIVIGDYRHLGHW